MAKLADDTSILGVYSNDTEGKLRLVHRYQGGDYGLEEIVEKFGLGRADSLETAMNAVVVLSTSDIKELKVMADAHSFDYEEGFIEMCLEIQRFASTQAGDNFRFTANF